jgi:hypothetical protein
VTPAACDKYVVTTVLIATVMAATLASAPGQPPLAAAPACVDSAERVAEFVTGELKAGSRFERRLGPFVLRLTPAPDGWDIGVFSPGRPEDLSAFTLPLRGPNHRHLYAWHFRNEENTGPNTGSVNAPQRHRSFSFHPEVGRAIRYEPDFEKRWANFAKVEAFGQGTLDLLDFTLTNPQPGTRPSFLWLKFNACLSWPRSLQQQ